MSTHTEREKLDKKSVKFVEGDSSSPRKKMVVGGRTPPSTASGRQRARTKANPGLMAAVGVAMLAALMMLAPDFTATVEERKTQKIKEEEAHRKAFSTYRQTLDRLMEIEFETKGRKDACDIFLGKSSIPNAGYSLFAGRDFAEGDLILSEESRNVLPVRTSDQSVMGFSSFAFLIKSHPLLHNLKGSMFERLSVGNVSEERSLLKLVASGPITAGAELFIPHHLHPLSVDPQNNKLEHLFPFIPTEHDYRLVDGILHDIDESRRRMENSDKRKGNPVSSAFLFGLMHRTISKFDLNVVSLMPTTLIEFDRWQNKKSREITPASIASLTQPSLNALQFHGHCWTDLVEFSKESDESEDALSEAVTIGRTVQKDDVVTVVPVYVTSSISARRTGLCLENQDVAICPLSHAPAFLRCGGNQGLEANVKVLWSDPQQIDRLSTYEAKRLVAGGLSALQWSLVALRDLNPGEKIVLQEFAEDIFPTHWAS